MHPALEGGNVAPGSAGRGRTGAQPRQRTSKDLSPRLEQTLERLLTGDSEKQIARRLQLSPHTIHDYVKALYRHFDVSSRAELIVACLDPALLKKD